MATWGDYQSVIQLAAGLNFAYASLEVILDRPLLHIRRGDRTMIEQVRKSVQAKAAPRGQLDAAAYSNFRDNLDKITGVYDRICFLNPYVSAISGVASTVMLFHASNQSGAPLSAFDLLCIAVFGLGWFGIVLAAMSGLRIYINAFIEPKFAKLTNTNGKNNSTQPDIRHIVGRSLPKLRHSSQ